MQPRRIWWNWQTRYFEVVVGKPVQVQVLLCAPIFLKKLRYSGVPDTAATQETAESESANVKFPKRIKHRGRVLATIYAKCKGRDSYRVAWQVAGQRRMASFASYSLAKRHADALVKDLASGSQVTALHPAQARDALAALERLADFYRATGRRVSLLAAVSEFVESSSKLERAHIGRSRRRAILRTVANVKRKDIKEAVTEFLQADAPRTKAAEGQRAQLSAQIRLQPQIQLDPFCRHVPEHRRLRFEQGTPGHLHRLARHGENHLPQWPCRRFREIPQPLPRHRPAIPAMGSPQRLSHPDAPPD